MGKNMMKSLERRKRRAEARDEATDLVLARWEEFCTRIDVVLFYTFLTELGFHHKRIKRFYFAMIENQVRMIEEFRTDANDDTTHYAVMAKRVSEAGIDVKELLLEADKARMPEAKYEERQKQINELLGK